MMIGVCVVVLQIERNSNPQRSMSSYTHVTMILILTVSWKPLPDSANSTCTGQSGVRSFAGAAKTHRLLHLLSSITNLNPNPNFPTFPTIHAVQIHHHQHRADSVTSYQ
jgi:hypothetical protein